jgi:thioesterase domain-containing protein
MFLVHPAGGSVLCYRHLAARLERPVAAFEALVGDGGPHADSSVEDLAAAYAQALTQAHPEGPLLLGGWSSGGPIAFELAAQLRRAGRDVLGLVVIDSPAPAEVGTADDGQLFAWFIEDLDLPPAALHHALAWAAQAELAGSTHASRLDALARALAQTGHALPLETDALVGVYHCFDTVVRATARYRAPTLDVPLLVLRAGRGSVTEFARHPDADEPGWGWHRHTPFELHAHRLDATHQTLLTPDNAAQCAALISRWLSHCTAARIPTPLTGEAR